MAWPRDREELAAGQRRRAGLWGLGLLLWLHGCGNASSEAPRATTSEAGLYIAETLKTNTSTDSGISGPPQYSTSLQTLPPKRPMASASAQAGPSALTVSASTASADQAARNAWYATAWESPDVTVRLQALEQWAQRPGDVLDPVTYGLVDQDEAVRNRARTLYEQALARGATEPLVKPTGSTGVGSGTVGQ